MDAKETPGLGAGVQGNTPHEDRSDATATVAPAPLQEFPVLLASVRFPGRVAAIRRASTRDEAMRAVMAFAYAGMFVRHVTGAYNPMTRDAIANEAWTYVRMSPAAKEVRSIDVAAIVTFMDDVARERCGP
ncbi:hypothetical protein J2X04_001329 [Lysobacter niabensis]|uniref:Uncharacterized protein n=1 Tax=Agrilutibacter niabensis TaxID=380628 RepID=A0ABU1VNC5_9GAMM|nr:hypothetical protein [Lysobacter niabensis]MDR7098982.1 hypothetical protein [Lysobacter niabensis]